MITAEDYFGSVKKWRAELERLRAIVRTCGLTETLKWGKPCYTVMDKNVLILQDFKDYCAILFVKGALLKDPKGILIQQTENVQAARQLRFAGESDIAALAPTIKAYIAAAVAIEQAGLEVPQKEPSDIAVPEELQAILAEQPAFKTAFEALTPGRQRAYLYYFAEPKQAKTREARIQKCIQQILAGKGLQDKK